MEEILNPTVFIGDFQWREPITTLTDFLVAIVALIGFIKFSKFKGIKKRSFYYYKYYFLFFAIGMTSAAWIGHGLQEYIGPEYKRIGWFCGSSALLMLGLGSFNEIKILIKNTWFVFLTSLFIIQYLCFVFLLLHPVLSDFIFAQISSTVALILFIFPIHIYNYVKQKSKGSLIVISTIAYSIIPGLIYNNQVSFSRWFNYHDISHVLMAIFMCLMIAGTSKLALNGANH